MNMQAFAKANIGKLARVTLRLNKVVVGQIFMSYTDYFLERTDDNGTLKTYSVAEWKSAKLAE